MLSYVIINTQIFSNIWVLVTVVDKTSNCPYSFCFRFSSEIRERVRHIAPVMLQELLKTFNSYCDAQSHYYPIGPDR